MNPATRYQESNVIRYDAELWSFVEQNARELAANLTLDFAGNLETTLANFLDLHATALTASGAATLRQKVLNSSTPAEAKQALDELMRKSRQLIPQIEALDTTPATA